MTYTTKADKDLVLDYVHTYVNDKQPMSIKSYARLMQWLNGYTYREIAKDEGVTASAVAYSVKHSVEKIKTFALSKAND